MDGAESVDVHCVISYDDTGNGPPPASASTNRDSNSDSIPTLSIFPSSIPEFSVGGKLVYCRDGHMINVTLISLFINNKSSTITYSVQLPNENIIQSTREFLQPFNEKDTVEIPETLSDYKKLLYE